MKGHEIVEKNIGLMTIFMVIAISFGGLVEIVPQFFLKQTTTPIEGLKPLNAVKVATYAIPRWYVHCAQK
jgi:cytochrome c oxidase cbb3-type subunit 2